MNLKATRRAFAPAGGFIFFDGRSVVCRRRMPNGQPGGGGGEASYQSGEQAVEFRVEPLPDVIAVAEE